MTQTTRTILELCRHEWLRERRRSSFAREMLARGLKLVVWISACLGASETMKATGASVFESLPYLLIADQVLRWMIQQTPEKNTLPYQLLPIRKWQMEVAYALRLTLMPINFMWLPIIWPQWWLIGVFLLSGYFYLWCWRAYLGLSKKVVGKPLGISGKNGFLACEFKLRFRHPKLVTKLRNSLIASAMLIGISCLGESDAYIDFAVLYALVSPSLQLLTCNLGYEQAHMPLLKTRLHSLQPVYQAKYIASLIMMLPAWILMLLPMALKMIAWQSVLMWSAIVALVVYPALLKWAPKGELGTPTAQITTLVTLTLPILIIQTIKHFLL